MTFSGFTTLQGGSAADIFDVTANTAEKITWGSGIETLEGTALVNVALIELLGHRLHRDHRRGR